LPELSDEELDALVEEATVDAYGDDEQLGGVTVTVQKVTQAGSGIVAGLREPRDGLGLCGDAPYPEHGGGRWRDLAWPCGSRPSSPTIGCHASEPDEP
jgi:hypothetical protein